jgi:hypothetical protein
MTRCHAWALDMTLQCARLRAQDVAVPNKFRAAVKIKLVAEAAMQGSMAQEFPCWTTDYTGFLGQVARTLKDEG